MKKIKLILSSVIIIFLLGSLGFGESLENVFLSKTNKFIDKVTANFTNILKGHDRVKYLDLKVGVQESLKPTISMTNVNSILEKENSAFFNQNSLSLHDNDQTINLGLGYRSLINNDKVMLGGNIFFDYSFDEQHQRNGAGIEAISSVFDVRGNYYDATSGIQTLGDGSTEEALDGWDARLDYHLPVKYDVRLFGSLFEFENAAGNFELDGEKYGLSANINRLSFEAGYVDDNKTGDGSFANISYIFPLGVNKVINSNSSRNFMEYVSVRDRLYEPVKRENKIRVVKISSSNVVVSGF
jgi:adhesin/invasin